MVMTSIPGAWLHRVEQIFVTPAVLLSLPFFRWHPRLSVDAKGRFGTVDGAEAFRHAYWFHGSSAGDMHALMPLIEHYKIEEKVIASAFTANGYRILKRQKDDENLLTCVLPIDYDLFIKRFIDQLSPKALVLETLECWPALLRNALKSNVHVAIVNGRISDASFKQFKFLSALYRPLFERLSIVFALDDISAERFESVGVLPQKIRISTSTKYSGLGSVQIEFTRKPHLLLASLHRGEASLIKHVASTRLSFEVAPRYPSDISYFSRVIRALGLVPRYYSDVGSKKLNSKEVLVIDTMGDLEKRYLNATIAFIGGTFVNRGGHNVLEAANAGTKVVVGPSIHHIKDEMNALNTAKVGWVAETVEEVIAQLVDQSEFSRIEASNAQNVARFFGNALHQVIQGLEDGFN